MKTVIRVRIMATTVVWRGCGGPTRSDRAVTTVNAVCAGHQLSSQQPSVVADCPTRMGVRLEGRYGRRHAELVVVSI